jgi:hypothetical protein
MHQDQSEQHPHARNHGVSEREHGEREARRQQHAPLPDPINDRTRQRRRERRRVGEESKEEAGRERAAAEIQDVKGRRR